jgi:hypothetical protein
MIPEALGVMVHQKYIDRAPPDYKGFLKHKEQCIANLQTREENEKQRKIKKSEKRDARKEAREKGLNPIENSFVQSGTLSHDQMET